MVYLGYSDEALQLYNKANVLNPFHQDKYLTYGSFIYFELGEYEKSIEISKKIKIDETWIDYPVFLAASYFNINDLENANKYWNLFLKNFKNHISSGNEPSEKEAIEWQINVNPFKEKTNLKAFWQYVLGSEKIKKSIRPNNSNQSTTSFIKKGDMWELAYQGDIILLKDAKGFHDIATMIVEPNKEFHCMELMGNTTNEKSATSTIDSKAKLEYQKQIKKLLIEIEDAKEFKNFELLSNLEDEYDSLVNHLSKSLGLDGKPRQLGSNIEKARSAVTWRIRSAIKKINAAHPNLGKHLSKSISTGTFCSYKPEFQIQWVI
jgi:tetratricopeptide (TPR) repeat protein